ncbi:PP2C family protein-serine/threonine phosphatase [Corynebacterium choanae]|uniref:PP2C-family Ser/Thr phosphatase n=1 Tax=Corynebacterium choanae TaxID=1862358 RepID=A0A3G6J3F0_9CORY|nr:protein phosphatase 2C domain-containing protein [Corynebacterium choanae]AZA12462.1 PP2C-family Ser/Thr phosphatase [Corynebacterium choanae]
MSLRFDYAICSDRGLVRGNNEDSAYAGPHLIALADGMGGHAAGEVASQLMINKLRVLDADPEDNDMLALLGSVADDGSRAIARHVRANPQTNGMGTTLTALMSNGSQLGLIHVGDSRGFRLREGKLTQITVDDTLVQQMVQRGEIQPEDVSTHPRRSLLLKAYDGRAVEPHLETMTPQVGDRYLLCSDGLTDPVSASTIEEALHNAATPQAACDRLVELALRSGGPDNVTVVVADIVDADIPGDHPLPVTPVTAGALNADEPEKARPDTAAGRAAVMTAGNAATPGAAPGRTPAAAATTDATAGSQPQQLTAGSDTAKRRRRSWPMILALVLAVVLLGVTATGWWVNTQVKDQYFVTTNDDGVVMVQQGVQLSLFGHDFFSPYQATCLDDNDRVSLTEVAAVENNTLLPEGCVLFTRDDLQPADREKIAGLTAGTYDEIVGQVQWLASRALPLCVTRTDETNAAAEDKSDKAAAADQSKTASTSASTTATSSTATPSTTAATTASDSSSVAASTSATSSSSTTARGRDGDRTQPGVDCRKAGDTVR